jgi:hypothetical protein
MSVFRGLGIMITELDGGTLLILDHDVVFSTKRIKMDVLIGRQGSYDGCLIKEVGEYFQMGAFNFLG